MTNRYTLLIGLGLGLTACGPAPGLLEPVQTHDVTGKPITIYQVKGTPPPLTPEQERAQIQYWEDYYTRHPEQIDRPPPERSTATPLPYSAVAGTWGYPYRTYYQPYRGPIRILGAVPVGPQGKHRHGSRRR